MAVKTILVVVGGDEGDRVRLDLAGLAAKPFDGHILALHIRRDPRDSIPLMGEAMSGALVEDVMRLVEQEAAERSGKARNTFDDWAGGNGVTRADHPTADAGVTASWREVTGIEDEYVARCGRLSDLIVVGRPTGAEDVGTTSAVEAAIFDTGRAVLVAPPSAAATFCTSAAIFWNGSAQAARAIGNAVPLLKTAKRVHILAVTPEPTPFGGGEALTGYLAWHGVQAESATFAPDARAVGQALLEEADRLNADLLVMGAYTHSRLRQIILGGVTKHVLGNAGFPVLMAH
jgi:nucleotide-binding universal stress UspA family protein